MLPLRLFRHECECECDDEAVDSAGLGVRAAASCRLRAPALPMLLPPGRYALRMRSGFGAKTCTEGGVAGGGDDDGGRGGGGMAAVATHAAGGDEGGGGAGDEQADIGSVVD